MTTPVYADNCQVCGKEHLSLELIPMRLGSKSFETVKTCLSCLAQKNDVEQDYRDAAILIIEALKNKIV